MSLAAARSQRPAVDPMPEESDSRSRHCEPSNLANNTSFLADGGDAGAT